MTKQESKIDINKQEKSTINHFDLRAGLPKHGTRRARAKTNPTPRELDLEERTALL